LLNNEVLNDLDLIDCVEAGYAPHSEAKLLLHTRMLLIPRGPI